MPLPCPCPIYLLWIYLSTGMIDSGRSAGANPLPRLTCSRRRCPGLIDPLQAGRSVSTGAEEAADQSAAPKPACIMRLAVAPKDGGWEELLDFLEKDSSCLPALRRRQWVSALPGS